MVKQVHFNEEREIQDGFNKITTFLGKFIFNSFFDTIKKTGLINCFYEDKKYHTLIPKKENERYLYVLFKNKKLDRNQIITIIKSIIGESIDIIHSYDLIENHFMIVIKFPKDYNNDYDNILQGNYSKLSNDFKEKFPKTRSVFNEKKQEIGKEYTLYYHIYNKTEWLRDFWMKKLGLVELNEKLELWSKPNKEDLTFDTEDYFKKLLKKK